MNKFVKFFKDFSLAPKLFRHVENWPAFLLDHFKLKTGNHRIHLRNGLSIEVRPGTTDKGIIVEVFLLEVYKPVLEFIQKSKVIIDVGAQIGVFSLYAKNANPEARIFSFEPCSDNFELLSKNLALNGAINASPQRYAISSETEEVKLYLSENNTGMHTLHGSSGKFEAVQGIGINDLFKKFGIEHCDLLKMDCEGSEVEIIKAIEPECLASIGAIVMEYHDVNTIPEIKSKLEKCGFKVDRTQHTVIFAWRD